MSGTTTDNSTPPGGIRKTCGTCGGSGQISFFRGVSRFVMDWDECPECNGTGHVTPTSPGPDEKNGNLSEPDRAV